MVHKNHTDYQVQSHVRRKARMSIVITISYQKHDQFQKLVVELCCEAAAELLVAESAAPASDDLGCSQSGHSTR